MVGRIEFEFYIQLRVQVSETNTDEKVHLVLELEDKQPGKSLGEQFNFNC